MHYSCNSNVVDKMKTAPNQQGSLSFTLTKVVMLKGAFTHPRAGWLPRLGCAALAHIQKTRKQPRKGSRCLRQCWRCPDISVNPAQGTTDTRLTLHPVVNPELRATSWLWLLVSNCWYLPQIWDPLCHSSYPSDYVAMGDHHSLGNSCGSTCVHDHRNIRGHRPGLLLLPCKSCGTKRTCDVWRAH